MPLSKPRWPMFYAVQTRAQLLDDMLCAAGIDTRVAVGVHEGDSFLIARAACIACVHSRDCRSWLDACHREYGAHAAATPPEFCSNREFIRICRSVVLANEATKCS